MIKKRILYLADGSSVHTRKWINALGARGFHIHLFSLTAFHPEEYKQVADTFSYTVKDLSKQHSRFGGLNKAAYLSALTDIKKTIVDIKPHLLHAHFASSYGLLAALTGFHPLLLSVWGYDVFHFPRKSFIHRMILKHNFKAADMLLSTGRVMAEETKKYTDKDITVTPFGVDLEQFKPGLETAIALPFGKEDIIVGTAKPLEYKYAIHHLIEAFAIVKKEKPEIALKCCIVGDGSQKENLKKLCSDLNIEEDVFFTGRIAHKDIPGLLNRFDIFAALSLEESFGVAVLEASACEKAVLVSDEGGLPEVVEHGVSGFVVPKSDVKAAAEKMKELVLNKDLRIKMGKRGRKRVEELYSWDRCVQQMQDIYNNILSGQ